MGPLSRIAFALPFVLAACGEDAPKPGPFTATLDCPKPPPLPFVPGERDWQDDGNEGEVLLQPRIKHQAADIMTSPTTGAAYTDLPGDAPLESGNLAVRGVMARIENERGLASDVVAGEYVSAWQYAEATGWVELGEQLAGDFQSSNPGTFSIDSGAPGLGGEVIVTRYSVLNAEGSCGTHYVLELPAASQVIVSDIDATLSLSDDEILFQVPDPTYDPLLMGSAVEMAQAWTAKGYQMIYLTARPHVLRSETRTWLDAHGFPAGPVITAPDFVFNEAARQYKAAWVQRIIAELGWDIVAAYGNATSDIDAYEDAAIDKATTFIVGPEAGTQGTVAIENLDYAIHIADYISLQPDANP